MSRADYFPCDSLNNRRESLPDTRIDPVVPFAGVASVEARTYDSGAPFLANGLPWLEKLHGKQLGPAVRTPPASREAARLMLALAVVGKTHPDDVLPWIEQYDRDLAVLAERERQAALDEEYEMTYVRMMDDDRADEEKPF